MPLECNQFIAPGNKANNITAPDHLLPISEASRYVCQDGKKFDPLTVSWAEAKDSAVVLSTEAATGL
jgi:hypothetical protein